VVGRIQILSGSGDLILVIVCALASQEKANYLWLLGAVGGLVMGFISAAPWYIFLIVYMILIGVSRLIIQKIWQAPLLAMFILTFLGSLLSYGMIYLYRVLLENFSQNVSEVFINIILPSTLINILLIFIIHPLVGYLSKFTREEIISE
jgi:cell shape-determining protein MreD